MMIEETFSIICNVQNSAENSKDINKSLLEQEFIDLFYPSLAHLTLEFILNSSFEAC